MNDHALRKYLIWAFALAWPIQLLASWFALRGKTAIFQLVMVVCMFTPFLAVLLAKIPLRDMGWKPALRGKWKWVLAAWLVPAVLTLLGAALYSLCFPDRMDFSGQAFLAQLEASGGQEALQQFEAQGLPASFFILVQWAAALLYAPVLNTFISLSEEVGWRGAMLPRLKARFGRAKGWLLGGLIWGVWHWPVMILAGYEYGLHYWGAPVLGPLVFCLFTTALGTLLDLLYEKSRCIWVPSLGHGAINAIATFPLLFLDQAYADRMILGPAIVGLIGGIPLFLLAAVALVKAAKPAEG